MNRRGGAGAGSNKAIDTNPGKAQMQILSVENRKKLRIKLTENPI